MSEEDIFHEALTRDPANRAAYLDRVCPDPARRASVEALLRANVNTRLSGQQCAADATKFVLTRKQGQTSFEGEGTASTGNFQVTLAP